MDHFSRRTSVVILVVSVWYTGV